MTEVHLWLIHVVQEKLPRHCNAITPQSKKDVGLAEPEVKDNKR